MAFDDVPEYWEVVLQQPVLPAPPAGGCRPYSRAGRLDGIASSRELSESQWLLPVRPIDLARRITIRYTETESGA